MIKIKHGKAGSPRAQALVIGALAAAASIMLFSGGVATAAAVDDGSSSSATSPSSAPDASADSPDATGGDGWTTTQTSDGGVQATNGQTTIGWKPSTAVQPDSASGCNGNVCINISGSGLLVNYFNTQTFGNVGCIRAHHRANGRSIYDSPNICPTTGGSGVYYSNYHWGSTFPNNTKLCASWDKMSGYPCETVHS